jgi:hypothetical protein
MPFLIVNYGAEMVYILEQRLEAQSIQREKSSKVLTDVITAMLAPNFVAELFRPQRLYPPAATKEIFDRLVHSSIMRLSENSMDKLYDLMTMGCKYQLVTMRNPRQLIEVTLNHIDGMRDSLKQAPCQALDDFRGRFMEWLREQRVGELADTRHGLLSFFQGRRVKVSLFLQDGMQNSDATFNIPVDTHLPPLPDVDPPGTIKYFENDGVSAVEAFAHPRSALRPFSSGEVYDPLHAPMRENEHGRNLYLSEQRKKKDQPPSAHLGSPAPVNPPAQVPPAQASHVSSRSATHSAIPMSTPSDCPTSAASTFLNSLAASIVAPMGPKEQFKLNLFHQDEQPLSGQDGVADDSAAAVDNVVTISRVSKEDLLVQNPQLAEVIRDIGGVSVASQPISNRDRSTMGNAGEDLLDLMDA